MHEVDQLCVISFLSFDAGPFIYSLLSHFSGDVYLKK